MHYWHKENLEPISEEPEDHEVENKLLAQAEKRLRELSKKFIFLNSSNVILRNGHSVSDQSINEYVQLRTLLTERAELKLQAFYEETTFRCKVLLEETRQILAEQHMLLDNYADRVLDKLKPEHTFFEHLSALCSMTRTMVMQWLQWKHMLVINRWYYCKLSTRLNQYHEITKSLYDKCISLSDHFRTIASRGVHVLCRLHQEQFQEEDEEDTQFEEQKRELFSALDNMNEIVKLLKELQKSTTLSERDNSRFTEVCQEWTLDYLLKYMAAEDGRYLVECVREKFLGQLLKLGAIWRTDSADNVQEELMRFDKNYTRPPAIGPVKPLTVKQVQKPPVQNAAQVETSDYYSSSASSSKTMAEVEEPKITKQDSESGSSTKTKSASGIFSKKNRKNLQIFYSNFLEHKYVVFNSLLEEGARHRTLNSARACRDSLNEEAKTKKGVRWLDDTLKKNKQHLWKRYVENLWKSFLDEFSSSFEIGRHGLPASYTCQIGCSFQVAKHIFEILLLVQLPRELSPFDIFINSIRKIFQIHFFEPAFHKTLLCAISNKECSVTRDSTGTIPAHIEKRFDKLRSIIHLDDNLGGEFRAIFSRFLTSHAMNRVVSCLTAYDLPNAFPAAKLYTTFVGNDIQAKKIELFICSCIGSKMRSVMRLILDCSFPIKKYWHSHRGPREHDVETFLNELNTEISEAVLEAIKGLPERDRPNVLAMVIELVLTAWLTWMKENNIRFSRKGAVYLRLCFDTFRRQVLCSDWLNADDKCRLAKLQSFTNAFLIADILEGETPARVEYSKTPAHNAKVAPGDQEDIKQAEDLQIMIKRDLQVWEQYRKPSLFSQCICLP